MRTAPIEGRPTEEIFDDRGINRDSTPRPASQIKFPGHNRLSVARARRDAWLDTLELMADWREELAARIWLASQFPIGAADRARLAADTHAFSAECLSLAESLTAKQRRAAA